MQLLTRTLMNTGGPSEGLQLPSVQLSSLQDSLLRTLTVMALLESLPQLINSDKFKISVLIPEMQARNSLKAVIGDYLKIYFIWFLFLRDHCFYHLRSCGLRQ
jgi:hypothetical protein